MEAAQMLSAVLKAYPEEWRIVVDAPYLGRAGQKPHFTLQEGRAGVKAFLGKTENARNRLREGLKKEVQASVHFDPTVPLPNYTSMRDLSRLLRAEGWWFEQQKQYGKAADTYLDIIQFGNEVAHGNVLIGKLTSLTIIGMGLTPLQELLPRLDEPSRMKVAVRLSDIDAHLVPMSEIYAMEKEYTKAFVLNELQKYKTLLGFLWEKLKKRGKVLSEYTYSDDWLIEALQNPQRYMEAIDQQFQFLIEIADKPFLERQKAVSPVSSFRTVQNIAKNFGSAIFISERKVTQLRLILLHAGISAYHHRHRRYPDSLEWMVPEFLTRLPADPFTGKPFLYHKTLKGFLLYSPGPDGKDDGGTPITDYPIRETSIGDITLQVFEREKVKV